MAVTSTRTLRLLSLLQSRRHWSGADLAERLGVSVRTLRRDVDRLREIGYPVDASRGADGGYALAPGVALPPLVLDDDEAVALAVGLSAAAATSVSGVGESSLRALAKLVQVMPARLRRRVDAVRAMTEAASWGGPVSDGGVDPAALTTVALACRDGERITFGYTAADGQATERAVEPFRLVSLGRRWYLLGWDLDRTDWRVFRLDRVTAPRGTGARFAARRLPAADAATFVRERLGRQAWPHAVEAVVAAPAAEVRARIGAWAQVADDGAGRCRVQMDVDDLSWAAAALGRAGASFTVVRPPELRDTLRDLAARFTAAAG
ncbi:YafY family protein [Modestobacter sp. NPDC049651]|uniref:helix-turn-helix transcriptional regulator n=1 Tax=unclassified Modestobacter TaxID=2643866 RepID=UPI0033EEA20A